MILRVPAGKGAVAARLGPGAGDQPVHVVPTIVCQHRNLAAFTQRHARTDGKSTGLRFKRTAVSAAGQKCRVALLSIAGYRLAGLR
jgi:hypothetical protein